MAWRVMMAEVSGGRVQGRPRLGWMDGVKVALGNRVMTVEAARQCARKIGKSGEPWYTCNWMSFTHSFLLGPVFFQTTLPWSCSYHLERGGMPLRDAVGINCKKGAITENQDAGAKYMDEGVYVWWLCVCYLSWHHYPSLVEGESHGILLLLFANANTRSISTSYLIVSTLFAIFFCFFASFFILSLIRKCWVQHWIHCNDRIYVLQIPL